MRKPSVTVRVPATTGNVGPGFDTLGIALKMHNQVSIREMDESGVQLVGATPAKDSPATLTMVRGAADAFFARSKIKPHGIQVEIKGEVPISRGFGSSVTVRLGIVFALNETDGRPLSDAQMLDLVAELEGHSDNCAPALFGGFVVSGRINGALRHRRFSVPPQLKFVCCLPDFQVSTEKARSLLPKQVALRDAVENLNRVALITSVFASGEFSLLRGLFGDKLHQPYRKKLVPQFEDVIAAGTDAGALGGWLSGSGPGVICLTEQKERAVAEAMANVFVHQQIRCETHVLVADNDGTRVKRN
ncbi:MAG TPA: homoserine kinase [Verrucomicrobiae bacterium]|nr:homoserine kinase [Verrucomicrobiae bacterium]